MTETTLRTEDGRTALRIEHSLPHPVEKVWRALTEPSELNQWFPFDVRPELAVGGTVRFLDKAGGSASSGVITDLVPKRLIAYTWEADHLRWELRPTADGCLLVLTHTVADRFGSASFATGWHACIDGLADLLACRPVQAPTGMDAVHERFITELRLDVGSSSDTPDGWLVRYERQLVRPAEAAWRALVGNEQPLVGGSVPVGCTVADFAAGRVTEVEDGTMLEYEWRLGGQPAGRVRVLLGQGTGHGARLVLTQTGPADRDAERATALTAWREHVERLAGTLAAAPVR